MQDQGTHTKKSSLKNQCTPMETKQIYAQGVLSLVENEEGWMSIFLALFYIPPDLFISVHNGTHGKYTHSIINNN